MSKDGGGFVKDTNKKVVRKSLFFDSSSGDVPEKYRGSIVIRQCPNPKLARLLEEFDVDGSGTIDFQELSYAAWIFQESKKAVKWGSVLFGILCLMFALVVVSQTLLVLWIVDTYQYAEVDHGVLKDVKTGELIQTHTSYSELEVSSCVSDEQLREMRRFDVKSPTGNYISMEVLSVARHRNLHSKFGSVIVVYTFIGDLTLDGSDMTFNERVAGAFAGAGFKLSGSRRRLQGVVSLLGFFDILKTQSNQMSCASIPTPTHDLMTKGSWTLETTMYTACHLTSCVDDYYDLAAMPLQNSKKGYPETASDLAYANTLEVDGDDFNWVDGVEDVDGQMFYKHVEHSYGVGTDKILTSYHFPAYPSQTLNEVRNLTHVFEFSSWEGKNYWCNTEEDDFQAKIKAINEAWQKTIDPEDTDYPTIPLTAQIAEIDGKTLQQYTIKLTYGEEEHVQHLYEHYYTGFPYKLVTEVDGRIVNIQYYKFAPHDGMAYTPADLELSRADCLFSVKDAVEGSEYTDARILPPRVNEDDRITMEPDSMWLQLADEESRRRIEAESKEFESKVDMKFKKGDVRRRLASYGECADPFPLTSDAHTCNAVGDGFGFSIKGGLSVSGRKITGEAKISFDTITTPDVAELSADYAVDIIKEALEDLGEVDLTVGAVAVKERFKSGSGKLYWTKLGQEFVGTHVVNFKQWVRQGGVQTGGHAKSVMDAVATQFGKVDLYIMFAHLNKLRFDSGSGNCLERSLAGGYNAMSVAFEINKKYMSLGGMIPMGNHRIPLHNVYGRKNSKVLLIPHKGKWKMVKPEVVGPVDQCVKVTSHLSTEFGNL